MNRLLAAVLLAGALLTLGATDLHAQHLRPERTVFIRPSSGLVSYVGDNNRTVMSFDGPFPYSLGLELGYQFARPFSISAGYLASQDPRITAVADPDLRHTAQFAARYTFGSAGLAPYLQLGAFTSSGSVYPAGAPRKEWRTAYGPMAGLGLDLPLSGRVSLFVETNLRAAFPDAAMDGYDDGGFGDFDLHSSVVTGLKINFRKGVVPAAVFTIDGPTELPVGQAGRFSATTNDGRVTRPVRYRWDYGDGTTGEGLHALHTFAKPGTYTVRFTASNRGATVSEAMVVRVTEPPVAPAITGLTADPADPDTRTAVRFSARTRGDAPLTYHWSFGDGTTSNDPSPTHTFSQAGTFTVTMQLGNGVGQAHESVAVRVRPYEAEICSDLVEMNAAFFERNASMLTAAARRVLEDNAQILMECASVNVRVEGYAAPGERQPRPLSEDRARVVKAFYVERGIASNRIDTVGRGTLAGMTSKKDGNGQHQRAETIPLR